MAVERTSQYPRREYVSLVRRHHERAVDRLARLDHHDHRRLRPPRPGDGDGEAAALDDLEAVLHPRDAGRKGERIRKVERPPRRAPLRQRLGRRRLPGDKGAVEELAVGRERRRRVPNDRAAARRAGASRPSPNSSTPTRRS